MQFDEKEFYNGRALLPILSEENILICYRYDSDKISKEEKYREISYFITPTHLIKTTARHHSINIKKWCRDDFLEIEKTYDVKLFNTEEFTSITQIKIKTSLDEIIEINPPKESTGEKELGRFIEFIREI